MYVRVILRDECDWGVVRYTILWTSSPYFIQDRTKYGWKYTNLNAVVTDPACPQYNKVCLRLDHWGNPTYWPYVSAPGGDWQLHSREWTFNIDCGAMDHSTVHAADYEYYGDVLPGHKKPSVSSNVGVAYAGWVHMGMCIA